MSPENGCVLARAVAQGGRAQGWMVASTRRYVTQPRRPQLWQRLIVMVPDRGDHVWPHCPHCALRPAASWRSSSLSAARAEFGR